MKLTTQDIALESLDALAGVDTLVLFVGSEDRPLPGLAGFVDWRLCGTLSRLLKDEFFSGAEGDAVLLPVDGRLPVERVMVLGVGPKAAWSAQRFSEVLSSAAHRLNKAKVAGVALELPAAGALEDVARGQALTSAFVPVFQGERVVVLAEKSLAKVLPR